MPIEYTNQPVRLKITAELEFEDGQSFTFERYLSDFSDEETTVAHVTAEITDDIYEKLEEFSNESEEEGEDDWQYDNDNIEDDDEV